MEEEHRRAVVHSPRRRRAGRCPRCRCAWRHPRSPRRPPSPPPPLVAVLTLRASLSVPRERQPLHWPPDGSRGLPGVGGMTVVGERVTTRSLGARPPARGAPGDRGGGAGPGGGPGGCSSRRTGATGRCCSTTTPSTTSVSPATSARATGRRSPGWSRPTATTRCGPSCSPGSHGGARSLHVPRRGDGAPGRAVGAGGAGGARGRALGSEAAALVGVVPLGVLAVLTGQLSLAGWSPPAAARPAGRRAG